VTSPLLSNNSASLRSVGKVCSFIAFLSVLRLGFWLLIDVDWRPDSLVDDDRWLVVLPGGRDVDGIGLAGGGILLHRPWRGLGAGLVILLRRRRGLVGGLCWRRGLIGGLCGRRGLVCRLCGLRLISRLCGLGLGLVCRLGWARLVALWPGRRAICWLGSTV